MTTIEEMNPELYYDQKLLESGIKRHLYDKGNQIDNVKSFLGRNVLLWFLPTRDKIKENPIYWVNLYNNHQNVNDPSEDMEEELYLSRNNNNNLQKQILKQKFDEEVIYKNSVEVKDE